MYKALKILYYYDRHVLEHAVGQKNGPIMPERVLVIPGKAKIRDSGLRQNHIRHLYVQVKCSRSPLFCTYSSRKWHGKAKWILYVQLERSVGPFFCTYRRNA